MELIRILNGWIFLLVLIRFMFQSECMQAQGSFPPEWSEGIVWYQIFPERFHNADTSNDPQLKDQKGAWVDELIEPWQIHPWESDWYALQDYEKANQHDLWFNISRRRYGGDLQGIINKLDYLDELGVGAIYLNPVFVSPSHHKYDIAYYHHVCPHFGPDPEGDWEIIQQEDPANPDTWQWTSADSLMLQLIREVHKRDMKIILDGVFNHAGYNFFAFQDLLKNQQKSEYKDWFTVHSWDTDTSLFEYEGWWGVKVMPEFRENKEGLAEGPRQYIFDITRRWMDPEANGDISKGIDGWRLDVADQVSHAFWRDWRDLVKDINPNAFLTGEVTGSIAKIKPYLQGEEFDAVMNYNFTFAVSEFFIHPDHFSVQAFDSALRELRTPFPFEVNLAMQNFLGSHDTDRPLSRIMNQQLPSFLDISNFFDLSSARNPDYITTKPNKHAKNIYRLMLLFQMTYPGAPVIYYGDETGMWGAKDPGSRKPMLWTDRNYIPETYLPDGSMLEESNIVKPDTSLQNYISKLISIRKSNTVLERGNFIPVLIDNERSLYGFFRIYQQDSLLVILNNSAQMQEVRYDQWGSGHFLNLINNEVLNAESKSIIFILQPYSAVILGRKLLK